MHLATATLALTLASGGVSAGPVARPTLHVGDALPDAELVASTGARVHLAQWKGQAVALTFIFTRCAMAQFCPRLSATFAHVQQKLAGAKGVHLVSVTFDPAHDTPQVLAAYAKAWHADPARWSFLTGEPAVIDALCERFDVERVNEHGTLQHTMATAVIGPDGRIRALYSDASFTAEQLAQELLKASSAR